MIDFNTSDQKYYFVDNIWNSTVPLANVSDASLVGEGSTATCQQCSGQTIYYDTYPSSYLDYSLPLSVKLVIRENDTSRGAIVSFGYQVLQNGTSSTEGPLVFFDKVLIPGSKNTTLLTTPYYFTPAGKDLFGNYYDTELVFAGESGGANTRFTSLGSSLWIYYLNNSTVKPFPSAYTFGLSTAESATNARTLPGPYGAVVIQGKPNLAEDIFAPNALESFTSYIENTSRYTQNATTTVKKNNTTVPQSLVINPSSNIKSIEVVLIAAIVIVLIIILELHKRDKKRLESLGYQKIDDLE